MSKENRKAIYDILVAAGDLSKLSDPLKAEFGDPSKSVELSPPPPKKELPKKKEGKK